MATPQQLDHLRKLKALADRPGTGAEGKAAKLILEKKRRQFGVTEAQLMQPAPKQQKSYPTSPDNRRPRNKYTDRGHEQPEAIYGDLEARRQQAKAEWQRQHNERWTQQTRATWSHFQYQKPSNHTAENAPMESATGQQFNLGNIVTTLLILILLLIITQLM